MWTLIAHRCGLANHGDYVLVGHKVAYNDNGNVIVAENKCPHRGTRVFDGVAGNRNWICPYHGWSYFDGRVRATKTHEFSDADLKKATVALYHTQWVGDWLFYAGVPSDLDAQLGDMKEMLEAVSKSIVKRHSFDTITMACDWRVAVENTLEDYHVPLVHPGSFDRLKVHILEAERHGKNSIALYTVNDERTVHVLENMVKYFDRPDALKPRAYFHILLYPHTTLSSVGGFTFSLQHYLHTESGTQLITRMYLPASRADSPDLGFFFDEARNFNLRVFDEDAMICARVPEPTGVLGAHEERIRWFRESH